MRLKKNGKRKYPAQLGCLRQLRPGETVLETDYQSFHRLGGDYRITDTDILAIAVRGGSVAGEVINSRGHTMSSFNYFFRLVKD